MTPQQFSKIFWKQYLLLEKDFLETDEFVTIDKSNFKTLRIKSKRLAGFTTREQKS